MLTPGYLSIPDRIDFNPCEVITECLIKRKPTLPITLVNRWFTQRKFPSVAGLLSRESTRWAVPNSCGIFLIAKNFLGGPAICGGAYMINKIFLGDLAICGGAYMIDKIFLGDPGGIEFE